MLTRLITCMSSDSIFACVICIEGNTPALTPLNTTPRGPKFYVFLVCTVPVCPVGNCTWVVHLFTEYVDFISYHNYYFTPLPPRNLLPPSPAPSHVPVAEFSSDALCLVCRVVWLKKKGNQIFFFFLKYKHVLTYLPGQARSQPPPPSQPKNVFKLLVS